MASYIEDKVYSFQADGALEKYKVVKLSSTEGKVATSTDGTDVMIGITRHTASDGDSVAIQMDGIAKVEAAGTVSIGDYVSTGDTTGRIDTAVTSDNIIGVALQAADGAGDIIEVLLTHASNAA